MKETIFLMFIYLRERERESERARRQEGAEREGDRGSKVDSVMTTESLVWSSNS